MINKNRTIYRNKDKNKLGVANLTPELIKANLTPEINRT